MDVRFLNTTSSKVGSVAVTNGQLIALSDTNRLYYDLNGTRRCINPQGNSSTFGIVKVSDAYTSSAGTASAGVAASSYALNQVYNILGKSVADGKSLLAASISKYVKTASDATFATLNTNLLSALDKRYSEGVHTTAVDQNVIECPGATERAWSLRGIFSDILIDTYEDITDYWMLVIESDRPRYGSGSNVYQPDSGIHAVIYSWCTYADDIYTENIGGYSPYGGDWSGFIEYSICNCANLGDIEIYIRNHLPAYDELTLHVTLTLVQWAGVPSLYSSVIDPDIGSQDTSIVT